MLKQPSWPWLLAIFAAILVAVFYALHMGWIAAPDQICEQNAQSSKENCAFHDPALVVLWRVSVFVKENSESFIALGTIALAIFTFTLWRATDKLLSSAQEDGKRMERSIGEAAKAATAMEGVAASMAINAEQVVASVAISRSMVDQQKRFAEMQMRARISVLIGSARYQNDFIRFEASPIIINTGQTAALGLRYRIMAAILPIPLPDDFKFHLPPETKVHNTLGPGRDGQMVAVVEGRIDADKVKNTKMGVDQSLYVWGSLRYKDIFGQLHRCTFAQQLYWERSGPQMESGEIPEMIKGWHLGKHNRAN